MVGVNGLGLYDPSGLSTLLRQLPAKFAAVVSLLPTWLTMRLRFEVYEANVRGSPVEFSFSSNRTSREELRARGARRTRKMRRKFGARYNAPKEGAMVEE